MDEDIEYQDDDADDGGPATVPMGRWSWLSFLAVGVVQPAEQILRALSEALGNTKGLLLAHVADEAERTEFDADAHTVLAQAENLL